jgi:hypothetical protein
VNFQRANLVETTDNSEDADNLATIKDLNHANSMVRVFALGKIKRTLLKFTKQKELSALDKVLLKGFYTNL